MLPAPLLLPQSGGCGRLAKALPETSANARVRQQKENGRASGRDSGFRNCHMWLNGQKPSTTTGPTPRTRRCERSGRSPECRRQSLFLLHHQKAHSLFPLQEKENGGFEAAGLPRHPRANGKRSVPAAEPQAIGLRRTLPRPGRGAPPHPARRVKKPPGLPGPPSTRKIPAPRKGPSRPLLHPRGGKPPPLSRQIHGEVPHIVHRRGIAIPGPFGSANRAASSKPARFFRRWRRFAGFLGVSLIFINAACAAAR